MHDLKHLKAVITKILPQAYDGSLSSYELLYKVIDYVNKLVDNVDDLKDIIDEIAPDEIKAELEIVNSEIEKLKAGDYIDNYITALAEWLDKNAISYFGKMIKLFSVSLENGHFTLSYPTAWKDVNFDTGVNPEEKETFGHLIISY